MLVRSILLCSLSLYFVLYGRNAFDLRVRMSAAPVHVRADAPCPLYAPWTDGRKDAGSAGECRWRTDLTGRGWGGGRVAKRPLLPEIPRSKRPPSDRGVAHPGPIAMLSIR